MGKKCACGHTKLNHVPSKEKGHMICVREKCQIFLDFCDFPLPPPPEKRLKGIAKQMRDCQTKVVFLNEESAYEGAKRYGKRVGWLTPYKCNICQNFHLTSQAGLDK